MKLVVDQLQTTLEQDFTVTDKLELFAVRPRIYLHNDPAGTFTLSVKYNGTTLGSGSLTLAQIISGGGFTAGQYHHGQLKFELSNAVILNPGDYTLELSASGYAYSSSSYLGWIRDFEDLLVEYTGTPLTDLQLPLSFELWGFVNGN